MASGQRRIKSSGGTLPHHIDKTDSSARLPQSTVTNINDLTTSQRSGSPYVVGS